MNIDQAVHEAAQATDAQLRKTYGVALARGATNTGCMPEEERPYGTLRLLTLAILRLPDLALIPNYMHIGAGVDDPVVLGAAHDVTGGVLRLAHRALETHGRDVGYEIGAWIDDALLLAGRARAASMTSPSSLTGCVTRRSPPTSHDRHRRDRDARTRNAVGEHPAPVRDVLIARVRAPMRPRVPASSSSA